MTGVWTFPSGREWLFEVSQVGDIGFVWQARPRGSIVCGEGIHRTMLGAVLAAHLYAADEEQL